MPSNPARKRFLASILLFGVEVLAAALGSSPAAGYRENLLYVFCPLDEKMCAGGLRPLAGLVIDGAGNLYGTTLLGGNGLFDGVVFELTPNPARTGWRETVLYRFCSQRNCADGAQPMAGLVIDGAGDLYGTTYAGGAEDRGVVFRLAPNRAPTLWTETVLHDFCTQPLCADGSHPAAGLAIDGAGNLYGTTTGGGQGVRAGERGVAFRLAPDASRTSWRERVVYDFCIELNCADGGRPSGGLVIDGAGDLYGTTSFGGTNDRGTVFRLAPNGSEARWTHAILYSFCAQPHCADGREPRGDLVIDGAGNLYGTTLYGGNGLFDGVVFELTPNLTATEWSESVLYGFCAQGRRICADGDEPANGVIMDGVGNLYGTTFGGGNGFFDGVAFALTPDKSRPSGWAETVLHYFAARVDGTSPSGLVIDGRGNLYGTTSQGAGLRRYGSVFELLKSP
jgi:uncharacterized repeat protein (TIGR03803 family)